MRVFLPYPPSANERLTVRKDGGGFDSRRFISTPKYRAWKKEAAWLVAMAVKGGESRYVDGWLTSFVSGGAPGNVPGPYSLRIRAMPPAMKRSRDLDNLIKATSDALKNGGMIEDDSLCQSIYIEWDELDGPGVLCEVQPCPLRLLPKDGSGKSQSGPKPKRPRQLRQNSPRGATTPAAKRGARSDTGKKASKASDKTRSSTSAASTVFRKTKPET